MKKPRGLLSMSKVGLGKSEIQEVPKSREQFMAAIANGKFDDESDLERESDENNANN